MNKIFKKSNGKIIDLGNDFDEAVKYKPEDTLWLTANYKPVFSSHGEYMGYTTYRDFIEV